MSGGVLEVRWSENLQPQRRRWGFFNGLLDVEHDGGIMLPIAVGMVGTATMQVAYRDTAEALGNPGVRVLGTPLLINLLETAAGNALLPALAPGVISVGSTVNIKHLAATPVGSTVTARAEIIEIEGKRLAFKVEASDPKGKVAEGTHDRYLVDKERFFARLGEGSNVNTKVTGEYRFQVRWAETDAGGIVFYPNYLVWCDESAGHWMAEVLQWDFNDYMAREQCGYVTGDVHCHYSQPVVYGETVVVQVWLSDLGNNSFKLGYTLSHGEDGKLIAEAQSTHIWIRLLGGGKVQSIPIPDWARAKLAPLVWADAQ